MSKVQRILVPIDFNACSEEALRYALFLGRKLHARIDALHIWEPSPYVSPTSLVFLNGEQRSFWEHNRRELTRKLTEVIESCRAPDDPTVTTKVEAGYPSHSILAAVEENPYDLVVMGTHGRKWLSHVLLGSVAGRVVRLAPCAVLTVRAPEEAEDKKAPTIDDVPVLRGFDTPTHL